MKPTTTANIKIAALTAVLFGFALAPSISFASQGNLVITEVMYDSPGSDSGREWIEIANTGAAVDVYGYKLFEGGVNHAISVAAGTSTLTAGEVAVISNNAQKFLEDFPNYTGTLFKSSFSLSNTGESLTLKDNKLLAVSEVTYSSNLGAAGDGNSLHKSAGNWVPGAPNPGSVAITTAIKPASAATPTVKTSKSAPVKSTGKTKSSTGLPSNISQAAAVGASGVPFQMPALPQGDTLWTTALGLVALIIVGVGGVLYVRSPKATLSVNETAPTAEEFEIL